MMWAGGPSTRILITCTIEWSKSSWIKGAIEKGANEGQVSFAKDLVSELRKKFDAGVVGGKRKSNGKKKAGKRKREEYKGDEGLDTVQKERTGVLGKVTDLTSTVGDTVGGMCKPLFTSTGVVTVLLLMVFCALIRVERTMNRISNGAPSTQHSPAEDLKVGYLEHDALWEWIDSRIGKANKEERDGQLIWNSLAKDGVGNKGLDEVEDAIRTTEGKLKALKGIVEKKKGVA
jgi:VAD1 Analog of StAR-related lipid transfer domain